jgi:cytochrome P450
MSSPTHWPDASSFIPERWMGPYKGVEPDRRAFLPFSGGSRSCIGQQFALKELRLILATLLHRYELRVVEGQSTEMRLSIVPYLVAGRYEVDVRRRVR